MSPSVVWKYPIFPHGTTHRMPRGALVLSVAVQRQGEIVLYALVDPQVPLEERRFLTLATGEPYHQAERLRFVGTCQPEPGLWFHVFEMCLQECVKLATQS